MMTRARPGRRKQIGRLSNQTAATGREARRALLRSIEMVEERSKRVFLATDGGEVFDRVRLSDQEREANLRMALTWLNEAETQVRLFRSSVERLHEWHLNEALR